jgi:hypothetical protein
VRLEIKQSSSCWFQKRPFKGNFMTRPNPDDQKQPKTKLKRRAIPVFFFK